MVGLVLFIRFMVGHVLCAIMALHVRGAGSDPHAFEAVPVATLDAHCAE